MPAQSSHQAEPLFVVQLFFGDCFGNRDGELDKNDRAPRAFIQLAIKVVPFRQQLHWVLARQVKGPVVEAEICPALTSDAEPALTWTEPAFPLLPGLA